MTTDTSPNCSWKVREVLAALGPPKQIRRSCVELGLTPPGIGMIKMWRSRKAIPGTWAPTVIKLLQHAQLPLDDYLETTSTSPF